MWPGLDLDFLKYDLYTHAVPFLHEAAPLEARNYSEWVGICLKRRTEKIWSSLTCDKFDVKWLQFLLMRWYRSPRKSLPISSMMRSKSSRVKSVYPKCMDCLKSHAGTLLRAIRRAVRLVKSVSHLGHSTIDRPKPYTLIFYFSPKIGLGVVMGGEASCGKNFFEQLFSRHSLGQFLKVTLQPCVWRLIPTKLLILY